MISKKLKKECVGAAKVTSKTWDVSKSVVKKTNAFNKKTKLFYLPKL